MATKNETELNPTGRSETTVSSTATRISSEKSKAKLKASELFRLGEARRPLPPFVDKATTWSKVPADVKNWIQEALAESPVRFPWFWFGPVGCGKSSAAACVFQAAPDEIELEDGRVVRCRPLAYRLDDLVQLVKTARRFGSVEVHDGDRVVKRTETLIFETLRRASVVVIDEVAQRKERSDAFDKEKAIIDKIADHLQFCRAIITSNVPPKKRSETDTSATLMHIYDARIASRLLANGVAREFVGVRMRNSQLSIQWQDKEKGRRK